MSQHSFHGVNNGGVEPFPEQNKPNPQFENTTQKQRNTEVSMNSEKSKSLNLVGQRSKPSNVHVNRGTTHIFYKTRMCQKFVEGNCRNGDGCTFAHGPHDLRQPPPNWQELTKDNRGGNGSGNWNDDHRIIQRMRICRKFYNGDECPYGERCNFLHESPSKFKDEASTDNGSTRETYVINIQTVVDRGQNHFAQGLAVVEVELSLMQLQISLASCTSVYFSESKAQIRRVESDGLAHGHPYARGSVAPNTINVPITEPLVHAQQDEPKGFLKLANKKLNHIYGDWIDDEANELR